MMDLFTRKDLLELAGVTEQPSVSLYLPTHRTGPETREDPIRFKNLLQEAERQAEWQDFGPQPVRSLLETAASWLEDRDFWQHQEAGLAVFLMAEEQRRYRLPMAFPEAVHLADRPYITPLLPLLQSNAAYCILAASQGDCRLFLADRDEVYELQASTLPKDLQFALGRWRERNLNLHSMQRRPHARPGGDTAMYHGHEEDATKIDLAAYFRRVDAGIADALGAQQPPLVFAGVDYLFPIFRENAEYRRICESYIPGNPEQLTPRELHARSWKIVEPLFTERERQVLEEFGDRAAQGTASSDRSTVLEAAANGLVETLIIARPETAKAPPQEQGSTPDNPVEQAVLQTLQSGGDVLTVGEPSLPGDADFAALLRAPVKAAAPTAAR